MLDIKFIRKHSDAVMAGLKSKNVEADIPALLSQDETRRGYITDVERLKEERNTVSEAIGEMKRKGGDASTQVAAMQDVSRRIKDLDAQIQQLEEDMTDTLMRLPNIPHSAVPRGASQESNVVVKEWGTVPKFDFEPKAHYDLAQDLGILDLKRAVKLSGSGFPLYVGAGAKLERSLLNFMLDVHTQEHGYTEVFPPFVVNAATMTGTGQLPKMKDDMYHVTADDLYLIPTAEVPVTNIHRDETLNAEVLPVAYVAYTPCFRREAGSYGKETRGITRVHQFDKVELVRLVRPEDSYAQLELLRGHAETILQKLKLPYRVVELCTGDLSFAAAKCYDIEVWSPAQNAFLEVSSCSNFEDFQARRMNLKYKDKEQKPQLVHTLNGSGLALARTFIAILENYQRADGSIAVPEVLQPYLKQAKIA